MPRPTNIIVKEEAEIKSDFLEINRGISESSSTIGSCDKLALLFRMNSVNNERSLTSTDEPIVEIIGEPMEESRPDVSDVKLPSANCGRRMALADIFENVNENELVTLLSVYVKNEVARAVNRKWLDRRGGKSNIFEDISCDDLKAIMTFSHCEDKNTEIGSCHGCDSEHLEASGDSSLSVGTSDALNHRRGGKFDIFEGLSQQQKQEVFDRFCDHFQSIDDDSSSESENGSGSSESDCERKRKAPRRRGGKFDIFEGLTDEERLQIFQSYVKNCCVELDELEMGYGR